MSNDAETRLARAVRVMCDAVPVPVPDPVDLIARARPVRTAGAARRGQGWVGPLVTAAAVLVLLATAALWPLSVPNRGARPAAPEAAPVIPVRPAGLSLLTAAVSEAPPGPVALAYVQGNNGPRSLHLSQTVVVGVDGRTYRRVDLAERRGRRVELGTWEDAPVLLAADGTRLAVGSQRSVSSLPVLDLRDGRVRQYGIEPTGSVEPLAWSPDGSRLAYAVRPATAFGAESPPPVAAAQLSILDLRTGATTRFPVAVTGAAFDPGGNRVAVQGDYDATEAGGRAVRVLDLSDGTWGAAMSVDFGVRLAGQGAWSPDGRLLAVVDNAGSGKVASTVRFLALGGAAAPEPIVSPESAVQMLGWRSADRLLITGLGPAAPRRVYEATLDGAVREVVRIGSGFAGMSVTGGMQAATGLLPDAQLRDAGAPRRGPLPWWWRAILVGCVALLASLVYLVRRWHRCRLTRRPK